MNPDDTQTVSKIDSFVKIAKDTIIVPFGIIKVKGIIKAPNHYKCVNVVVDDLPENQCCKDVVIIQQTQVLKPGSNKISVLPQNLSCRALKIRKGTKITHVEVTNVVPSFVNSRVSENVLEEVAGNVPKSNLLKNLSKKEEGRVEKILESLNLQGIESWTEQQQQSARNLIKGISTSVCIEFE